MINMSPIHVSILDLSPGDMYTLRSVRSPVRILLWRTTMNYGFILGDQLRIQTYEHGDTTARWIKV